MQLEKNFTLSEFEHSDTAIANNIDNRIPDKYLDNVKKLAKTLQIIRDEWKKPIKINSGYRCKEVNTLVKGAANSQHCTASAADITAVDKSDNKALFDLIVKLVQTNKITTRQIIWEYGGKVRPNWIHIGIPAPGYSKKNNQILYYY